MELGRHCRAQSSLRREKSGGDGTPTGPRRDRLALGPALAWALIVALAPPTNRKLLAADFDATVAPLFARKCLGCHNASDKKGGLDLSASAPALAGGESGAVIVPGKPDESLLWERVSEDEMPPKKPLSQKDKQLLKEWIAGGAKWGTDPIDLFQFTTDSRAGYDWWALGPLKRPGLPTTRNQSWCRNPIDHFVLAGLEAQGLAPSAEADRRTLIRRLSFDLIGLPPGPPEVAAFLADNKPGAYERLVDRLLESPHYGERWGRHWLDIVRFGESQGFERDRLRPNAWPYRDWVTWALNNDLPYDEFVRQQVAGDVLRPGDPQAVIATGFLTAGPWDEVGQTQQSEAMKAVVRQDELEDLIAVTGQTFLGLTVNCARCHDHKFDPVSQQEYYRLAAVLAGVRHGERDTQTAEGGGPDPQVILRRDDLARHERQLAEKLTAFDEPVRRAVLERRGRETVPVLQPVPLARWEFEGDLRDSIGELHGTAHGHSRVENGKLILDGGDSFVDTAPIKAELNAKTLEVWLLLANLTQRGGAALSVQSPSGAVFDAIVFGEKEPGVWMAGSNGFSRTQSFGALPESDAENAIVQIVLVYGADRTIAAYRNGRPWGSSYQAGSLAGFEAGKAQVLFGLRHSPPAPEKLLAGAIERAALYDRALDAAEVAALAGVTSNVVTDDEIFAELSTEKAEQRKQLVFELSRVRTEVQLLQERKTYAIVPAPPGPTFVLARGNPGQKGEPALPGGIRSLSPLSADFALSADAPDSDRRRRLAEWITDARNPLTPRVIVNRLWHYHFGTGIVDTPNDFGFNGGRPSHPALLDWLACELIEPQEQGSPNPKSEIPNPKSRIAPWSLKHIHRLIVSSAAYRQSSAESARAAGVDAANRLLWRKGPQRLDAESLRDTMLVVAGEFNPSMGGPGFRDFRTFTSNSQFYEPVDVSGFAFNRRTVYRTWVRSGRSELLDMFDCPDPSTTSPKRAVTTTPLQALALLNNAFSLRMANRLAARAEREAPGDLDRQIARIYDLAYNRAPDEAEREKAQRFARDHGVPALCRVIFNSNEFLYVD